MMVLVKYKNSGCITAFIYACMLVTQACCNATVCFICGTFVHFEKVWSPVVALCEKFLFLWSFHGVMTDDL